MIVARGMGIGGEQVIPTAGFGIGFGGTAPPVTPLPYGDDMSERIMRDDIETEPRADERIDR